MRGSKWDLIKPLLKTLQEAFPAEIHVALIIKPDNFWQKQKTNFGSSKFIFEVRATREMYGKALSLVRNFPQLRKKVLRPAIERKNVHIGEGFFLVFNFGWYCIQSFLCFSLILLLSLMEALCMFQGSI